MTFASLNNVKGFPGNPAQLLRRQHVGNTAAIAAQTLSTHIAPGHKRRRLIASHRNIELDHARSGSLKFFGRIMPKAMADCGQCPAETYDHVVAGPNGARPSSSPRISA